MLSVLTYVVLICAVILLAIKTFGRKRREGEPPIVSGSFIWGSAVDFSKHAVDFLHGCQRRYGNVFTIRLINQYLTIIMDPNSYETMSSEKNFDFDPIQKQVNWNVFSFVLKDAKKMIKETGKSVRGKSMDRCLESFISNLDISCERVPSSVPQHLTTNTEDGQPWCKDGLRAFTAKTAFDAIFNTVFGRADSHIFNAPLAFRNFDVFHKYFNYFWLGLPKKFFPDAMKALEQLLYVPDADELLERPDLSPYIRTAIDCMKEQGQTDADIKGHNLVFLHVNFNTFRLAFWLLDNLLENPKAMAALKEEIESLVENNYDETTNSVNLTVKDIEEMKVLHSVVEETSRLASGVFMVRYINEDTQFKTSDGKDHLMRKGDRVAIYPPAIHKHPEIFAEPLVFKYDRFVDAKFYDQAGQEIRHPVMAFGSLCPGKRFAMAQMKLYLLTILTRFDLALDQGEHAEYDFRYHGHEVLPPVTDVNVNFRLKTDSPKLRLVEQR